MSRWHSYTCRLYHTGKLWKKHSAITVNVRSSIKTIILVSKSLEKKTLRIWPHPLGNCLLLDPLPIGISDALRGGKYKLHPGMEPVTVSIFSWTYAGIHVMAPGVTARFSLNFLNSSLLLNVQWMDAFTKRVSKSFERLDVSIERVIKPFERMQIFLNGWPRSFERMQISFKRLSNRF